MPATDIPLTPDEAEFLAEEMQRSLERVQLPGLRDAYTRIAAACADAVVPAELDSDLSFNLRIGLESGRIRRDARADGEALARRIYFKTVEGRAVRKNVAEVGAALNQLAGSTLQECRLSADGPGFYSLTLVTDEGRLLVKIEGLTARVQSLEVG